MTVEVRSAAPKAQLYSSIPPRLAMTTGSAVVSTSVLSEVMRVPRSSAVRTAVRCLGFMPVGVGTSSSPTVRERELNAAPSSSLGERGLEGVGIRSVAHLARRALHVGRGVDLHHDAAGADDLVLLSVARRLVDLVAGATQPLRQLVDFSIGGYVEG